MDATAATSMDAIKAFISFCSTDRLLAQRLQRDLATAGCSSWQFDISAVPGTDAWDAILERIEQSEFFLVLLSEAAFRSRSVNEEISHAHYCSLNSPSRMPRIIPLVLQDGVTVPRLAVHAREVGLNFYVSPAQVITQSEEVVRYYTSPGCPSTGPAVSLRYTFWVFFGIIDKHTKGYVVSDHIVMQIDGSQDRRFEDIGDERVLRNDSLRLRFEGFKSITASDVSIAQ